MPDKEWSAGNILDVFGDPVARVTLVLASENPVAATDLADRLDVSDPTVYRRVDPLVEANLLRECREIDRKGNQPSKYETLLEAVRSEVDTDGYTVDVQLRGDRIEDSGAMLADLSEMRHRVESGAASLSLRSGDRDTTTTAT